MNKFLLIIPFLFFCSCYKEQIIPVEIEVVLHIKDDNHSSPLFVNIENKTTNADGFQWTFEGGEPSTSTQQKPGLVQFVTPGEHLITLEAWNDGDRTSKTFSVRVDSCMTANFKAEADVNNYAPARFKITNLSSGGSSYRWTFEGGLPNEYTGKQPPPVVYEQAGSYTITLTMENGSASAVFNQEIEVGQPLDASFTITPSFENADMEAPLRASLSSWLQGVETLLWECAGASIVEKEKADTEIYFSTGGSYIVYLNVSNGKDTKRISQTIEIKPNTNLKTMNDIRFGINTAQETIGCFYSTVRQQLFKSSELTTANGALIDIAYMGLNATFSYNRFVSPDELENTPLKEIPNAQKTIVVNLQTLISPAQFSSMTTDGLLKNITINEVDTETDYFDNILLPRVVLFQTQDGRKGAILIKEMINNGRDGSHIIADIKIQKNG